MGHEHKKIYINPFETAEKRGESTLYQENDRLNRRCLKAIDTAVAASNYEPDYYDLKAAARFVLDVYGAERVNLVLATIIRDNPRDGRYSGGNKSWACGIQSPDRKDLYSQTHPYVLNGLIDQVREAQKTSVLDRLEPKGKPPKQPKQEPEKTREATKRKGGEAI